MVKKKGRRNPELYKPLAVLADWRTLVQRVPLMTEEELLDALTWESTHQNRPSYVERLHRKYNARRHKRERQELLESAGAGT